METAQHKKSDTVKDQIISRINVLMMAELKPVCLGLAILYSIFLFSHYFFLSGTTRLLMMTTSGITTVILLFFFFSINKIFTNPDNAHIIGSLIALFILFNGILHLYLTGEPEQTTNLTLLILGSGFLFLSTPWFLFVISVTTISWIIVAITHTGSGNWFHFGFFMISSIALSIILHIIRKRTRIQSEKIRISEMHKSDELKKTIVKLEESQEKYNDLFENANDLIQSVNADGKFEYVNKAWENLLEYTAEDRKTLELFDIIHDDYKEKCKKLFLDVEKGKTFQNVETVFISKSGKQIFVEGSVNPQIKDGRFISTRAIFRDITERKKSENELKKLHEELKNVNERLKEAYSNVKFEKDILSNVIQNEEIGLITNSDGLITGITEKARNICGRSRLKVLNSPLTDLFESDDQDRIKETVRLANIQNFHSTKATLKTEKAAEIKYIVNVMKLNTLKEKQLLVILRIETE